MQNNKGLSTSELWAQLFKAPSIGSYLGELSDATLPTFADYIA